VTPKTPRDPQLLKGRRDELLGYRLTELGGGRCHYEWTPGDAVVNPAGFVHGGYVGLLVDDVCGTAVISMLDEWRPYPTASMHIDYLRGLRIGESFDARGVVVRAGRKLTVADCAVHDRDGQLMVRGSCTFVCDLEGTDFVGFSAL
jgi:uncharacterized protein (TIGR00369 family)